MKKIDLAQAVTILANVGVIAGIVFLGIELQQNNALLTADARRNRAAHVEDNFALLATDPELASVLIKFAEGDELTENEYWRARAWWFRVFTNWEWAYFQMSPTELSASTARWRRFFTTFEGLPGLWEEYSDEYDQQFVQWVDENVVNER